MDSLRTVMFIIGSILILFGYLRFTTDEKGNVNLNNYRITGGIGLVIVGMVEGTSNLVSCKISKKSLSALSIYLGAILFYISFRLWKY